MNITSTSVWDNSFFERFISISNRVYRKNKLYILENITTFEEMLTENAPFNIHHKWQAWICENENGEVVGRIFASTRQDQFKQNEFLPVGYFCRRSVTRL